MEEKRLEVLVIFVNGSQKNIVETKRNGRITVVEGDGIIPTGVYSHNHDQLRRLVHHRAKCLYPNRNVEVTRYKY